MIISPCIALQIHVHELRAEVAAVLCPVERPPIADELHDALDRLPDPSGADPSRFLPSFVCDEDSRRFPTGQIE